MIARKTPQVKIRFVRQYTKWAGNVLRPNDAADGRVTEVRVRAGREGLDGSGCHDMTNAEAKETAIWRLTARPGSVRCARELTNHFTGLTWHVYERCDGLDVSICTRPEGFPGVRKLTGAQTRAEALYRLGVAR